MWIYIYSISRGNVIMTSATITIFKMTCLLETLRGKVRACPGVVFSHNYFDTRLLNVKFQVVNLTSHVVRRTSADMARCCFSCADIQSGPALFIVARAQVSCYGNVCDKALHYRFLCNIWKRGCLRFLNITVAGVHFLLTCRFLCPAIGAETALFNS